MQTTTIIKATEYNYLSEFLEDFPDNRYVNKVLTGCGGTTVVLTNAVNYVICVPYVSLIINKLEQHPEVFGFYGGVEVVSLQSYIETQTVKMRPKKIMVTYDSLVRLCEYINPSDYKILIDEAHKLLDSASFRQRAVRGVMKNYERFRSYVFLTATPVKEEYQLPELRDIPKVEIDWGDIVPVELSKIKVDQGALLDHIALICIEHITGVREGIPYFYMNTVTGICKLVKGLLRIEPSLSNDNVCIICADNEANEKLLEDNFKFKWQIGKASDTYGKLNFCTSTAFEGADIYCETGVTYIISDGTKEHTKHDILTTIPQIIGRLRNSVYKNQVTLLYTDTPYYRYTTPAEYAEVVKQELAERQVYLEDYAGLRSPHMKKAAIVAAELDPYLYVEDGLIEVDAWSWHNEMHNYDIVNCQYSVRLQGMELINKVPYKFAEGETPVLSSLKGSDKLLVGKQPDFRDAAKEYVEIRHKELKVRADVVRQAALEREYAWLAKAYELLGKEGFVRYKWLKKPIYEYTILNSSSTHKEKVRNMLRLKVGLKYSSRDLKVKCKDIPGFTKLEDYYKVKSCRMSGKDRNLRGYVIQGIN